MRVRGLALVVALSACVAACVDFSGLSGGDVPDASDGDATTGGADATTGTDGAVPIPDAARDARPPGDAATAPDDGAPPPAPTYRYRRRVTIKNTSGTTLLAGFTISVPVGASFYTSIAGKALASYDDVRVLGDTSGERPRLLDVPGGVAAPQIHFAIVGAIAAGATSTEYAVYYGDPKSGAPPADGTQVFPVYDDFSAPLGAVWKTSGAPVVSGGTVTLRQNQLDAITTVAATDGVPIVSSIELSAKVTNPQSAGTVQPNGTFWYWMGYQHTGDFDTSDPWIIWISRGAGTVRGEYQETPGACAADCVGTNQSQTTAFRDYLVERDPTQTRFTLDGSLAFTQDLTNDVDLSIMVRNFAATSDLVVDWIRARARVAPDPTVTLGPEETLY